MKSFKLILIFVLAIFIAKYVSADDHVPVDNKQDLTKLNDKELRKIIANLYHNDTINKSEIERLKKELSLYEVERFLNIKDTSIFNSKFIDFDDTMVPGRCKSDYLLVRNIYLLNKKLFGIKERISNEKIRESATTSGLPEDGIRKLALETAKKDLLEAEKLLNEIGQMDTTWLSEEQQKYYRPFLVGMYNKFINEIYADNP